MCQVQATGGKDQLRFRGHRGLLPVYALPTVTPLIRHFPGACTQIPRKAHGKSTATGAPAW